MARLIRLLPLSGAFLRGSRVSLAKLAAVFCTARRVSDISVALKAGSLPVPKALPLSNMNATSRRSMVVLLATTALVTPLACKLEPRFPELRYSPNSAEIEKNDDLAQDEAAQAQLEGVHNLDQDRSRRIL
jgi:hypothetical protein